MLWESEPYPLPLEMNHNWPSCVTYYMDDLVQVALSLGAESGEWGDGQMRKICGRSLACQGPLSNVLILS